MNSPDVPESLLTALIHDLRQPLGNIECSVWCLKSLAASADPRIREQIGLIERQVEEASRLLSRAAAEIGSARLHRAAAPESLATTNSASSGVT